MRKRTAHYGIRPSGPPHIGNALTAIFACDLLDKVPGQGKLLISINDWDRCVQGAAGRKKLESFFGFLAKVMGAGSLDVMNTSDILRREKAARLIEAACGQARDILEILGQTCRGVPIFPLDPYTGEYAHISRYAQGRIHSISKDSSGKESHFEYTICSDTPIEMPLELKLALKHAVLQDEVDVFVLGGNYGFTIDKIKRISRLLGADISYELGPTVFSGRRVMSKSRGNIIALEDLLLRYSPDRIHEALLKSLNKGKQQVQAGDILNELFG